ncbi:MAG: FtsX-like permease family protein [Acidobacteriota bacterium]
MTGALALITVRQWKLHKLRLILTTLGIALGVAIFFAIQTTNTTLVDSLHTTIEKLAGKATLQVTSGDSGFSEDYLKTVRSTAGVSLSEPVTETMAVTKLAGSQKLLVLGLDTSSDLQIYSEMFEEGGVVVKNPLAFTSHADSIAVSRKFADRFGLKDGDKMSVQVQDGIKELTVRGFFRSVGAGEVYDGNVGVMDIAAAQSMFGRGKRIDRIDITNSLDITVDELQQRLAAQLPEGIRVSRPDLRGQSLESSVSSINSGLTIMSFLAFIICAFLIFNSFSISLNQRWKEIGILRAIGVTRFGIQGMFLLEAAVLGVIGSAIGVAVGFALARAAIGIVLNVSQTLYGLATSPKALEFNYVFAAEALIVGLIASTLAAWGPARAAGRLDPASALHNIETRGRGNVASMPRIVLGAVFVIGGLLLTAFTRAGVGMNIQLVYVLLIQIGMILTLPKIIEYGGKLLRPLMNLLFGAEGLIAVETMARSPHRTASTVGALMVGLAFVFSCAAFIVSQKAALNHSLDKSLNCDIQVASSQQLQSSTYHFSQATTEKVAALPGVDVFDPIRVGSIDYRGDIISVLAHDMNAYFTISPDLLDTGNPESARAITSRGEGVLVSNNFALRWNLKLGDPVELDTPAGSFQLPVVGMLDYYRSEKGTIFLDSSLYRKYWNDTDSDYIFINLKPGIDKADFKQKVFDVLAGDQQAFVYTHEEFKAWVSSLIDQFFALMYLQMVVAIFVAALGLANTMIISVDERRRELGIFRAIGGLRMQVVKMVLLEAVAISLIGLAAGALTGIFNAYYLVNTAAKVVAGFTVRLVFPYSMIAWALPLVIVVAVGAALWPAIKAARLKVVDAIGYE